MFNRDKLMNADAGRVANASFAMIDRLQRRYPHEIGVAGLAATFVLLCEHYGVRVTDVLDAFGNMRRDAEDSHYFQAVQEYIKREIR